MKYLKYAASLIIIFFILHCTDANDNSITYNGRVEADIISLSAQVGGTLDMVNIEEGDVVKKDQLLMKINTDKIELQIKSQQAQIIELQANLAANTAQVKQVDAQLKLAQQTLDKTKTLVIEGAATEQQQDELESKVDVLRAQKEALLTNKKMLQAKEQQLNAAIEMTQISLSDASITSPIDGVILNRFLDKGELVAPGRALVELADLSKMKITIYVSTEQLSRIKIGDKVKVRVDGVDELLEGMIYWIASESEFTPKTILTEETRTTLVYAVKVTVANPDGVLKIGMPVDVIY
ncbi:MAG: HlyD family efflux transporter periplasmic adaptor subunit [Calditrichaceae bacterium]|nr:HlyD family efflux transporter periplasmic adaptor subunit [Calditrichaceae bacterium]